MTRNRPKKSNAPEQDAMRNRFAEIPSVSQVLQQDEYKNLIAEYGRDLTVETLRSEMGILRQLMRDSKTPDIGVNTYLITKVRRRLAALLAPSLKPVINLTGTVLHTNLGRAPLPQEALEAVCQVASQASNLEFDLAKGKRGDRDDHIEGWLCRLTGAEAATVVNNNAAAVLLILNSLALRKEVPVSRGELVEIGGSFRMPAIMAKAGCKLVEVGTTNRTHKKDFQDAISARTALLMRVHPSNYEIQGFSKSVSEPELAQIAHAGGIPLVHDLGSGSLVDLSRFGLPHEATPMDSVKNGVDVISFSGDKLLGGPQCGIIVGRRSLIDRIKKNPMKRALRCDKLTLAALQALLPMYADSARVSERIPALRLLTRSKSDIKACAKRLQPALARQLNDIAEVLIFDCASQIGSGAQPVSRLPSAALGLKPKHKHKGRSLKRLADAFRALPQPVLGRIQDDVLLFDLRCLQAREEAVFVRQLPQLQVRN